MTKSTEKAHQDHIADRGHVSISLHRLVHKPSPTLEVMIIPEAKASLDKEWYNCRECGFGRVNMKSEADVIRQRHSPLGRKGGYAGEGFAEGNFPSNFGIKC